MAQNLTFYQEIADAFLQADQMATGLPQYLGFRITGFEPGKLFAEMEVRPELLTPIGNMHGGVVAAFCDHMLGTVCYPHMPTGYWAATTEFKLNLTAPISRGVVKAVASVMVMTRSTAVIRIDMENEGRAVCCAQGTCLLRAPK